jgi:hypothetical protein
MTARLNEVYRTGDRVEIEFEVGGLAQWLPGRVVGLQHPGLWARLADGRMWFVTNTRRIRPASSAGTESE